MPKLKEKKMAKRKNWLGILVIVLVFGMTVVGCDDGSGDANPLIGEWYYSDSGTGSSITFTSDGKLLFNGDDIGYTYTVSGSTLTVNALGQTFGKTTFSISGKTLTIDSIFIPITQNTYYKGGGSNGGSNGGGGGGVPKTLVITGISSSVSGQITVGIIDNFNNWKVVATGQGTVSGGTITIPLLSATTKAPFTGRGDFYIFIFVDTSNTPDNLNDDTAYFYTGGGNNASPYNLTNATTTIPFSQLSRQN